MKNAATIALGAFVPVLVLLGLVAGYRAVKRRVVRPVANSSSETLSQETHPSFLYGRVRTTYGVMYEGRLRWGRDAEAFWGDYFSGLKKDNPWVAHIPADRVPKQRRPLEIFGLEIGSREQPANLARVFLARFGDISRVEASGRDVLVTLKSGTVVKLDRYSASDFDDGVRVWDSKQGTVDLDSLQIRTIEFLPSPRLEVAPPHRLHGTAHTRWGDFTGFVQWDREQCLGSDELEVRTEQGRQRLPFEVIRSMVRRTRDSFLVKLVDGREVVLSGIGEGGRGVYVGDPRYGRVLIPWNAFEGIDFSRSAGGPNYVDFPPGVPLAGTVTTRTGSHFAGRLVFDLDESEITDTLDAPLQGVNYNLPFAFIASIDVPEPGDRRAQGIKVALHSGERLQLEPNGDLGEANAGVLVYVDGRQRPEYVTWTEVQHVVLNRPAATYPPLVDSKLGQK